MTRLKYIQRPALLPFSIFYGLAVRVRNLLFDYNIIHSTHFDFPVISIGNITVGGTGKTPHVEYLVNLLKEDYHLAILSRGYKRRSRGFLLGNLRSGVADIGDEPLQMKLKFPGVHVAVDEDRVHGVKTLKEIIKNLNVIILDDAFQHRKLQPGFSILLIDYNRPVFHDALLPGGNLREPWKNHKRADIIVVTKCPSHLSPYERAVFIAKLQIHRKQAVFFTTYEYGAPVPVFPPKHKSHEPLKFKQLRKQNSGILLVTGIANPKPLRQFLIKNVHIDGAITFPDHHNFDLNDLQLIRDNYQDLPHENKFIIVTEKDAVRLNELPISDKEFRKSFYYIPVEVKFLAKGEKPFIKRVYKYLKKANKQNGQKGV